MKASLPDNGLTVLANDTDPDAGDTLSVAAVGATQSGGTVTIPTGGQTVRYTPAPGFVGTDRFNYTVSDGKGGSMQMMVTVQVIAPAPALTAHLHANLSIFINGDQRPNPPSSIGRSLQNQNIAPIHTEAADGRFAPHLIGHIGAKQYCLLATDDRNCVDATP